MPPSKNTSMRRASRSAHPRFRKLKLRVLYRHLGLNGHFLRTHARRRPKCLPSLPRRMQLVVRQLKLHGLRTPLQVLGFSLVGQCLQSQRKSLLLLRLQLSPSLLPNLLLLRLLSQSLSPNLFQLFPNLSPSPPLLLPRLLPRRWLRNPFQRQRLRRPLKKTNGSPKC